MKNYNKRLYYINQSKPRPTPKINKKPIVKGLKHTPKQYKRLTHKKSNSLKQTFLAL